MQQRKLQWYENPLGATPCRFESGPRHHVTFLMAWSTVTYLSSFGGGTARMHGAARAGRVVGKPGIAVGLLVGNDAELIAARAPDAARRFELEP